MIRLVPFFANKISRTRLVQFTFDGQSVEGHEGENLVAALMRAGHLHLRNAPGGGSARGAFCCMGLCQDCVVYIEGRMVEACRTQISSGLVVERAQ